MSYRSIKRVLGETSLERKCRFLFGACLLLLVTATFWGVDRVAGNLVMTNTRNHGHDLIDIIMIKVHSLTFETRSEGAAENSDLRRMSREWLREIIVDVEETQDYRYEIVTLDPNNWLNHVSPTRPQDEVERQLLIELNKKFQQQKRQLLLEAETPAAKMSPAEPLGEAAEKNTRAVLAQIGLPDGDVSLPHGEVDPQNIGQSEGQECRVCFGSAISQLQGIGLDAADGEGRAGISDRWVPRSSMLGQLSRADAGRAGGGLPEEVVGQRPSGPVPVPALRRDPGRVPSDR